MDMERSLKSVYMCIRNMGRANETLKCSSVGPAFVPGVIK